ncbi:MAG: resolvase [Deltaproteobacteria bacterium HGW-Deltaproteobacteria-19]|nr:MAG: resolvase [Deltaproteobacteria bacterium HGW-Deltaproteobacteria-19]
MAKTVAYLRVSTVDPDTAKNRHDIVEFVNVRGFGQVDFMEEKASGARSWKERKIKGIIDELGEGDRLIVPEFSRLGRSLLEIMEIMSMAKGKGIAVYDVKNGFELHDTIQSKVMAMAFGIAAEIERDLIKKRTMEGLRAAKAQGKQLGRPKGPGKSKLDAYKEEIVALLKTGSTQVYIAKKYGTTQPNLYNWLKKNGLKDVQPEY